VHSSTHSKIGGPWLVECGCGRKKTWLTGWWYPYPSEKYDIGSWDDEIPNIWKVIKFHGSKPPTSHSYDIVLPTLFRESMPPLTPYAGRLPNHQPANNGG